jgi:hypothetical protein
MAKVFGAGLAIDAKGTIGKGLTFQGRPKGSVAMKMPRSKQTSLDNPTAPQAAQRAAVKALVLAWQAMSQTDKDQWDVLAKASGLNIAGYHYYLKLKGPALPPVGGFLLLEDSSYLLLEDGGRIKLE